jgi:hypothetical protein
MLLICPVRPGDANEELRYALRSWETNLHLPGGLALLTVGYKPNWLEPDQHIEGNKYKSMPLAVFDNVLRGAGAAADGGHEEVLYMNDDFFCLDPVGAVLPVRRNCTLAEQMAHFPANTGLWWPKSLRLTASWLDGLGFPHPDSYEVHRPLLARPDGMLEALLRWEGGMKDTVPQWRTAYGVLNKVEAYPVQDAKLGARQPGVGTPWISTSDQSWRKYALPIRKRFQKPSRWERKV